MKQKRKGLIIGLAIGALAKPVLIRAYRPFRSKVREKIYTIAFEFIQNFDAERPT